MTHESDSGASDANVVAEPSWAASAATGAAYCYATTLLVLMGVALGAEFVDPSIVDAKAGRAGVLASFSAWDGRRYATIAAEGYSYDPPRESSVAFFPAFPLLARCLMAISGLSAEAALLAVAQAFLLASFVVAAQYVRRRFARDRDDLADFVLLVLGLFPTTFYFRMAYSESLFLFLELLALLGMERRWRPVCIALVVGAATATRAVGLALLVPFAMHLWDIARCQINRGPREKAVRRAAHGGWRSPFALACARGAVLLPLSCWGIAAYMTYQAWKFGEPLAFVSAQARSGHSAAHLSLSEHAWRLLTLAPLAAVYDATSPCYWAVRPPRDNALFNLMFANPAYFLASVGCVGVGAWRGLLNRKEAALSAMLLMIPYVTEADRTCMASQARFASIVFPQYLVIGQVLARLPPAAVAGLAALSAVMLALYTAMFVNWYWFY